jgi:hypothetical protein
LLVFIAKKDLDVTRSPSESDLYPVPLIAD